MFCRIQEADSTEAVLSVPVVPQRHRTCRDTEHAGTQIVL